MPYSKNSRKPEGERPLSPAERECKIKELQAQQEDRLRRALGDALFQWLKEFEQDMDVLN